MKDEHRRALAEYAALLAPRYFDETGRITPRALRAIQYMINVHARTLDPKSPHYNVVPGDDGLLYLNPVSPGTPDLAAAVYGLDIEAFLKAPQ